MTGIVLAITAACCWSWSAILARLGLNTGIRASTGTLISIISSFLLVGILALALDFKDVLRLTPMALLWFGLIGVVNYVLGRQFNYASINRIGVVRASPLFASAPLFAMILAVSFLGESINPAIVIGTLAIVSGIYLVVSSR
jgi:drug/metabolite transporter (DMT)-like permease